LKAMLLLLHHWFLRMYWSGDSIVDFRFQILDWVFVARGNGTPGGIFYLRIELITLIR
jgi:hypothetical protein